MRRGHSDGVPVVGALVAELRELLLREVLVLGADEPAGAPPVLPPVRVPQEPVNYRRHAHHRQGDRVALDVARRVRG